jgi:hypothetical protein
MVLKSISRSAESSVNVGHTNHGSEVQSWSWGSMLKVSDGDIV